MARKFYFQIIPLLFYFLFSLPSYAQITSDLTLGTEVNLSGSIYSISAGTLVGNNLFHSFLEFNVDSGQIAVFDGPNSVENIIARVTGGNLSSINGKLQSSMSDASLYLINPAGVIFGEGASLEIGGSFYVTTADSITFGDGNRFEVSQETPLLSSTSPASFGFLDNSVGGITIQGGTSTQVELTVKEGKEISLIGGDLKLENTDLEASGGDINIVSVASSGDVSITETGLQIGVSQEKGDVLISESLLKVSGPSAGSFSIQGRDIQMKNSQIQAYSLENGAGGLLSIQGRNISLEGSFITSITQGTGQGSKIQIQAEETLQLVGEDTQGSDSGIESKSFSESENAGSSGEIEIQAKNLLLDDGSGIISNTTGQGEGGKIIIVVQETLTLKGKNQTGLTSVIQANTISKEENAGKSNGIEIQAKNLYLTEGATITSATDGRGQGGSVKITVDETLELSGKSIHGDGSWIFTDSYSQEANGGNAGEIEIVARNLFLQDGAVISSASEGTGEGGGISLKIQENLELSGLDGQGFGSWIRVDSNFQDPTAGKAGRIDIIAKNLSLNDGARISSITNGGGQGGVIDIQVQEKLSMAGESLKTSLTGENQERVSGIYAKSGSTATGHAGEVRIQAQEVDMSQGTIIKSTTGGSGNGGTIKITTEKLSLHGKDSQGYGSWIYTDSYSQGDGGDGGEIQISSKEITLKDGGRISSSTYGEGKGGTISLNDIETLQISGVGTHTASGIFATSNSEGNQGGASGTIGIDAKSIVLQDGAQISIQSANKNGGKISIHTEILQLEESQITTAVQGGAGNAGNIEIVSTEFNVMNQSKIIANAYGGNGGSIYIQTPHFIRSDDSVVEASSQFGLDGSIEIDSPNVNDSGALLFLPSSFADTTPWIQEACSVKSGKSNNSFVIVGREAVPLSPEDLQPSYTYPITTGANVLLAPVVANSFPFLRKNC